MDIVLRFGEATFTALGFHFHCWFREYIATLFGALLLWSLVYFLLLSPPSQFPGGVVVIVPHGTSLPAATKLLIADHVLAHPLAFELFVRAQGGSTHLYAGAYKFDPPTNSFMLAWRVLRGQTGLSPYNLTLIPGMTARQLAAVVARTFPNITHGEFLAAAEPYEGYLSPDTYQFLPDASPAQIVEKMRDEFDQKIAPQADAIKASGHSLSDVVILASIVEREAATPSDKRVVAGILWNRIKRGMPLQVDAVFGYIEARTTFAPSLNEITVDSPYNTYLHKGLPPGPISNPGLDSIKAAINPTKSNYLFYLSDRSGNFHWAVTYPEQQANQRLYLQ